MNKILAAALGSLILMQTPLNVLALGATPDEVIKADTLKAQAKKKTKAAKKAKPAPKKATQPSKPGKDTLTSKQIIEQNFPTPPFMSLTEKVTRYWLDVFQGKKPDPKQPQQEKANYGRIIPFPAVGVTAEKMARGLIQGKDGQKVKAKNAAAPKKTKTATAAKEAQAPLKTDGSYPVAPEHKTAAEQPKPYLEALASMSGANYDNSKQTGNIEGSPVSAVGASANIGEAKGPSPLEIHANSNPSLRPDGTYVPSLAMAAPKVEEKQGFLKRMLGKIRGAFGAKAPAPIPIPTPGEVKKDVKEEKKEVNKEERVDRIKGSILFGIVGLVVGLAFSAPFLGLAAGVVGGWLILKGIQKTS